MECFSLKKVIVMGSGTWVDAPFLDCHSLSELYFYGNPPDYRGEIFELTVTAYYPADNANWTDQVRDRFGEGITWIAM